MASWIMSNIRETLLPYLNSGGGERYTNEDGYLEKQAVGDKNIVTANGTGYLEFTRELLLALKADTQEKIEAFYDFSKNGLVR